MRRRRRWKVLRSYRMARLLSNVRVVEIVARLGSVDVLCAVLRSSCMCTEAYMNGLNSVWGRSAGLFVRP